ncbi:4-hydroxy-3-methylbut-2-enyl diphosphate reductase [Ectothiorhodosinus mongolicus]|uniref:4-hydroxy-3-methylbut-2-enyl diphosphate reductase n=1 Tax=Ectothiorhodosinus mongolicus TaxID=233100 RepID=A0A1R3VYN8_9GAMM|nr:4-hydroxy-3-methylbut-2-enyl diphosphate reductase [Ectothiorhodosinus mongolicus]ULX57158.1 4-hydroxy-3-methylbut-2-enyl diphosphate reductase [Ectothiorhodosinus mongolicus]SIT70185.1 4-hydroxy-3-methylbut-2-enyl diphosphate reductase [Ectothiorhodosinus mongolicus]
MNILLANPRGFCAGVDRAIEIVERALEMFGKPIYVRHEVVHNRYVVNELRDKGAIFVEELSEVPDGATVIFSAHGVAKRIREEADERGLRVFDATCPLVTKVHMEVSRHASRGEEVILIGHAGHPEVDGTLGQYDRSKGGEMYLVEDVEQAEKLQVKNPEKLAFVTQTTLSMDDTQNIVDALRKRFPSIMGQRRDDICYATQNRQDAVKSLATECDLMLVVGSPNSSNSNRLREIAEKMGVEAYLIDGPEDIDEAWLKDRQHIGLTAGASAPELLVQQVISYLKERGVEACIENQGRKEQVIFQLPRELRA